MLFDKGANFHEIFRFSLKLQGRENPQLCLFLIKKTQIDPFATRTVTIVAAAAPACEQTPIQYKI